MATKPMVAGDTATADQDAETTLLDVTAAGVKRLIAKGEVRYAFLNTYCGRVASKVNAACAEPAKWIRAHGTDVSRQAGLSRHKVLWLLPGAKP